MRRHNVKPSDEPDGSVLSGFFWAFLAAGISLTLAMLCYLSAKRWSQERRILGTTVTKEGGGVTPPAFYASTESQGCLSGPKGLNNEPCWGCITLSELSVEHPEFSFLI